MFQNIIIGAANSSRHRSSRALKFVAVRNCASFSSRVVGTWNSTTNILVSNPCERRQQYHHYPKQQQQRQSPFSSSSSDNEKDSHMIRLSKRMSELDICSRREADKLIAEKKVFLSVNSNTTITDAKQNENAKKLASLGEKVPSTLQFKDIHIIHNNLDDDNKQDEWHSSTEENTPSTTGTIMSDDLTSSSSSPAAIILNKPYGYVSGQPEDGHIPAIRLLTKENYFHENDNGDNDDTTFHWEEEGDNHTNYNTFQGYAPAGRLDKNSTGLLIFCKSGVLAKKILGGGIPKTNDEREDTTPKTKSKKKKNTAKKGKMVVDKEYIVVLEPAHQVSKIEKEKGLLKLPYPPINDLKYFKAGGQLLIGDSKPLLPLKKAKWIPLDMTQQKKLEESYGKTNTYNNIDKQQIESPYNEMIQTLLSQHQNENNTINSKIMNNSKHIKVLNLILQEGRKHQIKRMCRELLGYHVILLHRVRIGPMKIQNLPIGKWRIMKQSEVNSLLHNYY